MSTYILLCLLMLSFIASTFLNCEKDKHTQNATFILRDSTGNSNEITMSLTGDTLIINAARCGEGFRSATTKLARGFHCTGDCFGEVDWMWAYQQFGTVVTFLGLDSIKYEINSCIWRGNQPHGAGGSPIFDCTHCGWTGRRK